MIKIGITSCFFYPDVSRTVFGPKSLSYVENDMFRFVSQKGILPVLIPDLHQDLLKEILDELDGFVFQGGSDLAPETYGEQPIIDGKWLGDSHRDKYELAIMDYAIKSEKPVLAICRGMQLMNVYFGGTLYQDISSQMAHTLTHRDAVKYDSIHHKIHFLGKNVLSELYRDIKSPVVNSVHHQGVKELGNQLKVLAVCKEDNIIEALEYSGASSGKVLGVQWHPEFSDSLKALVIPADRLFNSFIEQILKQKS
jgi:putative glutamine amidotransferase